MSDDPLVGARARVREALGERLEAKATDAFCLEYVYGGGQDAPPGGFPLVIEMAEPPRKPETRRGVPEAGPLPPETLSQMRNRFMSVLRPVSSYLLRRDPYGETMRGEDEPGLPLTTVWLNRSVRSSAPPDAFAALADDPAVVRIDVPRRLFREVNRSSVVRRPMPRERGTGCTGKGVLVAVIDHEVAREHPALRHRVRRGRPFTKEPWGHPSDHGTAVAGLIGANSPLGYGLAPDVDIINYKVLASNSASSSDDIDLAKAIETALESGVRIANLSLYTRAATNGLSREALACDNAWDNGMTIVKSAGNRGELPDAITCPADARGVIVVGATDATGAGVQRYSSRGVTLNGRVRPDIVAPGGSEDAGLESCLADGSIGCAGWGTSLAAPHITGLLAQMLECDPTLTPDQQKERLMGGCKRLGGPVRVQGSGLVTWRCRKGDGAVC